MLNLCTLSGYEGVGKSTLIKHFQKNHKYYVIPETARLIMPLEESVLADSRDDLSYKSFISYLTNIHFLLSNKISMNVLGDRNLIDSLTYLKLYSKDQSICTKKTGLFIKNFLEEHEREHLYNEMVLIKAPTVDQYITDNVLSDPERKYGKNVQQYKQDAALWENIYCDIAYELIDYGLSHKLHVIDAFPDDQHVIPNVEKLIIR